MSAFYLTLLAVLLAGLGARDQVTIAGMTARQGQRPAVLIVAMVLAVGTAAFAAWAATAVAPVLAPETRLFLAAMALAFAGAESLVIVPRDKPKEPTNSLGALGIVLLAQQLTDAARFLVFGVAVATNASFNAGLGGAIGGVVLVGAAWAMPEVVLRPRARLVRRLVGASLLLVAAWVGLRALAIV